LPCTALSQYYEAACPVFRKILYTKEDAMAYEGDILLECPSNLDFTVTQAVVVSGASWNPCGHMIFCTGSNSDDARYFHVAGAGFGEIYGVYAYPKFMDESGYQRYLHENGKHEIRRRDVNFTNPTAAYNKLMSMMEDKWIWGVLPHNCATFAKEIVTAGGGDLSVVLNCPDEEVVKKIGAALDQWGKALGEQRGPKF
jgi:hypothetical protein